MQVGYEQLFSILRSEKEIEVLINPFITAFQHNAMEQLEGQIASAKIAMARLSSPQLYFVFTERRNFYASDTISKRFRFMVLSCAWM